MSSAPPLGGRSRVLSGEFADVYAPHLKAITSRYGQDVAQDVWLQLWSAGGDPALDHANPGAYAWSVAHSRFVDQVRREATRAGVELDAHRQLILSAEDEASSEFDLEALAAVFVANFVRVGEGMPRAQKQLADKARLWLLKASGEFTSSEIAQLLGASEACINTWALRTRAIPQAALAQTSAELCSDLAVPIAS